MKFGSILAPLAGLTLIACGGFTPMEGNWASTSLTVNEDTCGLFEDDATLEVGMSLSDDGATMTFDLGDDVTATCALEKGDFDCTPIELVIPVDGFDAAVTMTQTIGGSFDDEQNGSVSVSVDVTCEGDDCGTVGTAMETTFPCGASATATIAHSM